MNKLIVFALFCACYVGIADAASRDANSSVRTATAQQRVTTTPLNRQSVTRTTTGTSTRTTTARGAVTTTPVAARTATTRTISAPQTARSGDTTARATAGATTARAAPPRSATAARATDTGPSTTETRTGAAYEKCKNAYFACMDQFCQLKNDDYRRCSCSNRVYDLAQQRAAIQNAGEQLTVFNENLEVVGMTAAQATAMKTASEGENALTADTSASKALLQAIMNSIRGEDSSVGGKYSDLNSINLSFDTANAFGTGDAGQTIAAYNGQNLYSAVYPQCRQVVANDCNDASLQRAVTAYLMAIEQDCNTVTTAIETKQKQMKSAIREGSAMLDLARVENRQKHNSDDITTCLNNVEAAVLSDQVCGPGYRKCLDNGQFIDVSTGSPIAGVANFYELGNLLTFNTGAEISQQKLAQMSSNKTFVQNFEKRVKKFAQPALDKCTEQADTVWAEYLDKAMLDIYYAQQAKVTEIKQGCFDFVSACYMNGDAALTAAMKELTGDNTTVLQPGKIALNQALCTDYVNSCNNMFDGDIVADYIKNRKDTDTLTACRAIVKQCFDKFGGTSYENFYYPYSGMFNTGRAPDWFTLYEISDDGDIIIDEKTGLRGKYKSECAKQLVTVEACNDQQLVEQAFGGFDVASVERKSDTNRGTIWVAANEAENLPDTRATSQQTIKYGLMEKQDVTLDEATYNVNVLRHRQLRPTGVATEIYNQVVDILTTQCINLQGRFVETQFIKENVYDPDKPCNMISTGPLASLVNAYGLANNEDMCPRNYGLGVDTLSWGACLCWENGGRRSKWGKSAKCVAALPTSDTSAAICNATTTISSSDKTENWCEMEKLTPLSQVCPSFAPTGLPNVSIGGECLINGEPDHNLPEGII